MLADEKHRISKGDQVANLNTSLKMQIRKKKKKKNYSERGMTMPLSESARDFFD